MRRIDLTMDGDFSKPSTLTIPNGIRAIGDGVGTSLFNIGSNPIKKSELNSNFLTGDIDSINSRRFSLEVTRSIEGTDYAMCDRCGTDIIFDRNDTLCEDCDTALDEEYRGDSTMRMIFR